MKEKLLSLLAQVKLLPAKAFAASPFFFGLAIGYFCKPVIKFVVDAAAKVVHFFVG